MSTPATCECGRLCNPGAPHCCRFCPQGAHTSACGMLQVSLAEAAGITPRVAGVVHVPESGPPYLLAA